jgi:hypothetical protein
MHQFFRKAFSSCFHWFLIPFIIFFSSSTSLNASDSLRFVNNLKLGIELNYGYVYPHSGSIRYDVNENISGLKLTVSTSSYGRTIWDKLFRYPQYGAGILTTTLGNDVIFGRSNAAFVFANIPFSSKNNRLVFGYQIDFGIAYITRKFNIETNSLDLAIGSHFNFYGALELNGRYRLSPNNEIKASFNLSHFSNGKLTSPNLGINSVKFCVSYLYTIKHARYERRVPEMPAKIKRHNVDLVFAAGTKADDQITGKRYLTSSLIGDYKYNFGLRYSLGIGADAFYDQSLGPNKIAKEGGTYTNSDLFEVGVHASIYAQFSKLTILIQVGDYVHANYYQYTRIFSRIGFRYLLTKNVFFNLTLKAHYAIADFIEWGIGYRF